MKGKAIFKKYVDALLPKFQKLIEKVNGKRKDERTYLHKDTTILRREYKSDNKWEAAGVNTTYIAADFMAFDSPVDIKSRPTVGKANGKLPKAGIGRNLSESELTDLQTMEAQGGNAARIAKKVADDLVFCNVGLDELYEWAFLYGLYWGFVGMPDIDNPENMMVLDFRYLPGNTYGTKVKGEIDGEDIEAVIEAINDNQDSLDTIWISKQRFKKLRQTRWAQELTADYDDKEYTDDTTLKSPSEKKFKQVMEDEFECTVRIINRTVIFEKNGVKIKKKPWGNDRVIFTCNHTVGTFAYGQLAENRNRVPGVSYALVDDYKLVSRYLVNEPSLVEKTTGQAIAAPIIEDVDQIYVLDCTISAEVDEDAELDDVDDICITIDGVKYEKADVVAAFNALDKGVTLKVTSSDDKVIAAINGLNARTKKKLLNGLIPVNDETDPEPDPEPSVTPSISLDAASQTVQVDKTVTLNATVVPEGAEVVWESSDPTKATVSDGAIIGISVGETVITAKITVDGQEYSATCNVTVVA